MKQLFRMNLVEETASYSDRARLFREMEREAVPETPLDILQEFARSNAQALQQLAARAEPEMLERAYSCWPTPTPSTSPDCAAPLASPRTSPML